MMSDAERTNPEGSIHLPVMLEEVLHYIDASKGGRFLDVTLGGAGHACAILDANPSNALLGADRDGAAIARSRLRLSPYGPRAELVRASFSELLALEIGKFQGLVADLGMSSDQLSSGKGFSFQDSENLDMRMDDRGSESASELVNFTSERELLRVLRLGGVRAEAIHAAKAIVDARPISSAAELARAIESVIPRRGKIHPATVIFQALRMYVNRELEELDALLELAPKVLSPGGRLVIISFHSLEERKVAAKLREFGRGATAPASWRGQRSPTSDQGKLGNLLTAKAVEPSEEEVRKNSRARSAKLRAFEFF